MSDRILAGLTLVIGMICAAVVGHALLRPPTAVDPLPPRPAGHDPDSVPPDRPAPLRFQPEPLLEFPYDPIVEVKAVRPEGLSSPLSDGESVIGLEQNGEARAYPLAMMARPEAEVLNDTLGGQPVAVTWCLRCRDARAFRREVKGRALTFFIPGIVWRGNMVMQDRETNTLWSQILGLGEQGLLAGTALEPVPTVVTDWATWRSGHPATTVANLRRLAGPETTDQRATYTGEKAASYVLAFERGNEPVLWPLSDLARQPVVNDEVGGQPVLVVFDPPSGTASLFASQVDDRRLSFRPDSGGGLRDETTGSRWDPVSGQATDGPLKGRRLARLPAFVVRRDAWLDFHPASRIWSPRPG